MSALRRTACAGIAAALTGCCGFGDSGSGSAPAPLPPLSLDDLPGPLEGSSCARDDAAKLAPDVEALLAALPSPIHEKQRKRYGFTCLTTPTVLVALEYEDETAAKRALLHYAHRFVLPVDRTQANARPRGDLTRRGAVVAIVTGELINPVAVALRRERAFVTAVPGFPSDERGGSGSALPFVSRPGAFDRARLARDYDYGCPEKIPATLHACADLERYERGGEAPDPGAAPQVYPGTCVVKPYPTPTSPGVVEEACWFLWSPLGIDVGTVKSLGVSLGDVSLEKLRASGAAALSPAKALELRDAVIEHGPGVLPEWVDGADRAIVAGGKESLSVRADATDFAVVRATNDRKKDALLVAGFARSGALPAR